MPIRKMSARSPGSRFRTISGFDEITKSTPEKSLLVSMPRKGGRNNNGRITAKRRGGGHRKQYRLIDFKRNKFDVPGRVESIEYDPNRTANIALIVYADGERRYILAPEKLNVGDNVISSQKELSVKPGNSTILKNIPYGTIVHAVELKPNGGAQLARSAGNGIQIMGGDKQYIQLKMPSGEIRLVREECMATIGVVSNSEHANEQLGKAGRRRNMGFRPGVRGVAMSTKHPHSGGQGKSGRHGPGGPAKDLWGNKVGKRTRQNKRTNKFIVKRNETKRRKSKNYKTII